MTMNQALRKMLTGDDDMRDDEVDDVECLDKPSPARRHNEIYGQSTI
jgi:hypothetical protein